MAFTSVSAVIGLSGCVAARSPSAHYAVQPQVLKTSMRFSKEYVLAAGDQIEVSVRRFPEASRTLVIRPDGYFSLPMAGEITAAGNTIPELEAAITAKLASRLVNPEVTVIALQVRQPTVFVLGDVNTSTAVPLKNASTPLQAITYAGGLRRSAAAGDVSVIRLNVDGYLEALPVRAPAKGQPGPYLAYAGMALQADDIVFVPENGRSQVSRFLDDFINRPLTGVNSIVASYVNFRLVNVLAP